MAGPYFSLSHFSTAVSLYFKAASGVTTGLGRCKGNTLGPVQETLLCVEHKHHLFFREYSEKRRTGEMESTQRHRDRDVKNEVNVVLVLECQNFENTESRMGSRMVILHSSSVWFLCQGSGWHLNQIIHRIRFGHHSGNANSSKWHLGELSRPKGYLQ